VTIVRAGAITPGSLRKHARVAGVSSGGVLLPPGAVAVGKEEYLSSTFITEPNTAGGANHLTGPENPPFTSLPGLGGRGTGEYRSLADSYQKSARAYRFWWLPLTKELLEDPDNHIVVPLLVNSFKLDGSEDTYGEQTAEELIEQELFGTRLDNRREEWSQGSAPQLAVAWSPDRPTLFLPMYPQEDTLIKWVDLATAGAFIKARHPSMTPAEALAAWEAASPEERKEMIEGAEREEAEERRWLEEERLKLERGELELFNLGNDPLIRSGMEKHVIDLLWQNSGVAKDALYVGLGNYQPHGAGFGKPYQEVPIGRKSLREYREHCEGLSPGERVAEAKAKDELKKELVREIEKEEEGSGISKIFSGNGIKIAVFREEWREKYGVDNLGNLELGDFCYKFPLRHPPGLGDLKDHEGDGEGGGLGYLLIGFQFEDEGSYFTRGGYVLPWHAEMPNGELPGEPALEQIKGGHNLGAGKVISGGATVGAVGS
jgi:hypothetical protein